jgi:hypothetical protein
VVLEVVRGLTRGGSGVIVKSGFRAMPQAKMGVEKQTGEALTGASSPSAASTR